MSDPPTYDQHLLDRLNALKKSTVQLDPNPPTLNVASSSSYSTPEIDLSARLRSLRNGSSPSPSPSPKPSGYIEPKPVESSYESTYFKPTGLTEETPDLFLTTGNDDKELEELLAELGPEEQWLNPDDPQDIQKLLNEARLTLSIKDGPSDKATITAQADDRDKGNPITRDLDMSFFKLEEDDEAGESRPHRLDDESREAQDIVAKLLDEVNQERENEPVSSEESHTQKSPNWDEEPMFSLPSAPSNLPDPPTETSRKSLDFESDIAARMAALKGLGSPSTNELGLPSAPTGKPVDKVSGIGGGGLKKYTDEEIETWCVICNDDATVRCFGCGSDLYCARCWKEGHMGVDVGYEEKNHKWEKFRKPN